LKPNATICAVIYKYIEKRIGKDFTHNIRVTVFKAMRTDTEKVYIKVVSRYQAKEPFKKAKLTFCPGEGVAGSCFKTQSLIYGELPEYNERNTGAYYRESLESYNLRSDKVDKLNVKSCLFLGIPIKCFERIKHGVYYCLILQKKMSNLAKNSQESLK